MASSSSGGLQGGMGEMGTTDGLPDMHMYGNTNAPTAAQVEAAANLIKQTDASLVRFRNVNNAIAAGYTYRAATNGEEHLIYEGGDPAYQGLNPQDPSSLVYAINVKGHMPILLGAMYLMPDGVNGPQVGGGLTRWHSHLEVCRGDRIIIAGFNFALPGDCNPSTWQDQYTTQMLHVWVVAYTGGVFSDDLSSAATTAAAQAALRRPSQGSWPRNTHSRPSRTRPIPPANGVCKPVRCGWGSQTSTPPAHLLRVRQRRGRCRGRSVGE